MVTYIHKDGSPVRDGICIVPDNWVKEFKVKIRSNFCTSAEAVKRIIQNQLEVVEITEGDVVCVVR